MKWLLVVAMVIWDRSPAQADPATAVQTLVGRHCGLVSRGGRVVQRAVTGPDFLARLAADAPGVQLPPHGVHYSRAAREVWYRVPRDATLAPAELAEWAAELALAYLDQSYRAWQTRDPSISADMKRARALWLEGVAMACATEVRWAHEGAMAPLWAADLELPPHVGLRAVARMRRRMSWREIFAWPRSRSMTTEALLDADAAKPLSWRPAYLATLPRFARVEILGVLGLQEAFEAAGLSDVARLADGWHGDVSSSWLLGEGDLHARIVEIAWDHPADADEVCESLSHWLGESEWRGTLRVSVARPNDALECGTRATRWYWNVAPSMQEAVARTLLPEPR